MKPTAITSIFLLSGLIGTLNCKADIILAYDGLQFTNILGTSFDSNNSVYGVFVFESLGATSAKSIYLTASTTSSSDVVFDIIDTNVPEVITNSFQAWTGGLPSQWDVLVVSNVFGGPEEEQISTTFLGAGNFLNGDQAVIDLGATTAATGLAPPVGTWSSVPEPTGFIVALFASVPLMFVRRKRELSAYGVLCNS
ncbi:MAG: hypothetical protein KDB03_26620 [Planctomycetales bacterium]|nr:hypothetical protein [Planctomycetales bacterium]